MRNRLYPLLLLAFVPGCLSFHAYRPVAVQVRDAETKKPIPDADVRIWYPMTQPTAAPSESSGTTADDGVARLRAAPYGDGGVLLEAAAKGYLYEVKELAVATIEAIPRAHPFEDVDRRPVSFVVEMYAGPRPTVELVLPAGFHGQVKARIAAKEDVACPPGQRTFSYAVPAAGAVEVVGPALLRHALPAEFRARYADGAPLGPNAKGLELGFWPLKEEGGYQYFLVGTRGELEEIVRDSRPAGSAPKRPSAGGGGGGGRGRRGRRGGQSAADPSN